MTMEFSNLTLACVIRTIANKYRDKIAINFENNEVSYENLLKYSVNLAASLNKIGIIKNDKVAVIFPNCLEYLYVYFSLFLLGAWIVPLSIRYEPDEIEKVVNDSDAETIIYIEQLGKFNYKHVLKDLNDKLPKVKNKIVYNAISIDQDLSLNTLIEKEASKSEQYDIDNIIVDPDGVAILGYTSGTTGNPKGVMLTHKNMIMTTYYLGKIWNNTKEDVVFSVAPLYAAQGFSAILIDLIAGATMNFISTFDLNDICKNISNDKVTFFHTQPTMWSLLLSLPNFNKLDFSHLRGVCVTGSVCSPNLANKIESTVKCKVLNTYGLIEASNITTLTREDDPEHIRFNTVGKPIPGAEIKIVDKERKEVNKGEIGELAIRGYLMKGYYKNEDKSKEVIDDDNWLYTGDLARYYDDENISIVGRCKDMVIRGGFNVYPIDIEECLLNFQKIEDVSVVGKPDDILGESLIAFIVPKANTILTAGEVKAFSRGKIANYKIPDEVYFISRLPTILSGKVHKNILRKWALDGVPEESQLKLPI